MRLSRDPDNHFRVWNEVFNKRSALTNSDNVRDKMFHELGCFQADGRERGITKLANPGVVMTDHADVPRHRYIEVCQRGQHREGHIIIKRADSDWRLEYRHEVLKHLTSFWT